jgi:eukaryotic-like serine/threonine-protein kinase
VTVSPGTRLGPYEVTASIGRGGMGEVYRAIDTRLDRSVAIKLVGGSLACIDEDATLEQEARAAAMLNHPHICALHDVCRENGTPFLVMEYVDGETLAARLARGPVPVREAIRIAIQIGEALDHAHRSGVIHRDLKPANIMLTRSGVKVLDFGLATLRRSAAVPVPLDRTPLVKSALVSEQLLLGTVYYMAPERLEGSDGDAASDVFALGVVMYEMVTGRRPFESGSPAGVIAAILRSEPPPPSAIQPEVPPAVDWVIQKALAKQPTARWRAAGDIVEILRWLAAAVTAVTAVTVPGCSQAPQSSVTVPGCSQAPRSSASAVAASVALLLAVGSVFAIGARLPTATPGPSLTFSISPPVNGGFTPTPSSVQTPQFALSPDGRRLTFVAAIAHDPPQLWIRALDSLTPEPLAGTHGAEYPFWSPDGESIGFFADGQLKRIDLAGGPARVLAPAAHGRGGAWSPSGDILFAPATNDGIYRVPSAGGTPVRVTHVDPAHHEASHRWPQLLPDDRHFLYFVQSAAPAAHGIDIADLRGTESRRLLTSPLSATYVAPDHLLFVADDALMVQSFDWKQQRLVGDAMPLVAPIARSSNFGAAVSASRTGLLAYTTGASNAELTWMGRDGRRTGSVATPAEYVDFRLSPDGRELAVGEVDAQSHRPDLRVLDLTRGANLRLTSDPATDASPVWSPDGTRIVYRSNPNGVHDIYEKPANGAAAAKLLLQGPNAKYPTDWTPDGRSIVYHTYDPKTGADIWIGAADGSQVRPLVRTPFDELQGQMSRDGRWLAYTALESGAPEVYISSLTDADTRWQVSAGGGADPRWRADTRELFYISADSWLTVIGFAGGHPAAPRKLFQVRVAPPTNPYLSNYDVTADGQRFLVKLPIHDVTSSPIHVVTNWTNAKRGN